MHGHSALSPPAPSLTSPPLVAQNGAGPHNWGNPLVDYTHEAEDAEDGQATLEDEDAAVPAAVGAGGSADADADKAGSESTSPSAPTPKAMPAPETGAMDIKPARKMSVSDEERERARAMRHGAMKGDHGA